MNEPLRHLREKAPGNAGGLLTNALLFRLVEGEVRRPEQ